MSKIGTVVAEVMFDDMGDDTLKLQADMFAHVIASIGELND